MISKGKFYEQLLIISKEITLILHKWNTIYKVRSQGTGTQIMTHTWWVYTSLTYHSRDCERKGPTAFKPVTYFHLKLTSTKLFNSHSCTHLPIWVTLCLCSSWSHIQAPGDVGSSGGPPGPSWSSSMPPAHLQRKRAHGLRHFKTDHKRKYFHKLYDSYSGSFCPRWNDRSCN